jgi:acyl carrier protein
MPGGDDSWDDLASRIRKLFAQRLDIAYDRVTLDASLKNLGADSLFFVELVVALEEEFQIGLPDEDAERLVSIQDVVRYVASRLGVAPRQQPGDAKD